MLNARFLAAISEIEPEQWDGLFATENPFLQHAFLLALEECGCANVATGWQPQHLVLFEGQRPCAAMPLYLKSHSWGEFVFDWGWAEFFRRHGLDYYPKLLTAIPFTPIGGPRMGIGCGLDGNRAIEEAFSAVRELARAHSMSSWHLLFPDPGLEDLLNPFHAEGRLLRRRDIQFHWFNRDYGSFDGFLAALRSSRRKNLKRERRRVAEYGVSLERKTGDEITEEIWNSFYHCYVSTYFKLSGHGGYLTRDFFDRLREIMPDRLMLVVAHQDGEVVACALFLYDSQVLYGRYWGALQDIPCLHFEACFYQGIEFCIEQGIRKFDPGTQGEHKLLRGFEPVKTSSYHWIADQRFRTAIAGHLQREQRVTDAYGERAADFLPYRKQINGRSEK